jgi:calcium/calmodulin-dependent protein kinase (CaM kinase) II
MSTGDLDEREEILQCTERLLGAISAGNWELYETLVDPSLTCFEPEACGHLIDGLDFHHFYFLAKKEEGTSSQTTIVAPHIRVLGDVGIIAYTRLSQHADTSGKFTSRAMEETRVWHRKDGQWRQVHFHRSAPTR